MTTSKGDSAEDILGAAVFAATAACTVAWLKVRRWLQRPPRKPFEELPMPPDDIHWLRGHQSLLAGGENGRDKMRDAIRSNANEHGQIGIWTFNMPTLVVTGCEDAGTILRQEYNKKRIKFLEKHTAMFMGLRNVVALQGREWKRHRAVVLKALSPATVDASRKTIAAVAETAAGSLRRRIAESKAGDGGRKSYRANVVPIMKMITLDVFGRVAFSKDLGCTRRLSPSPVAKAFDFLETEFLRRSRSFLVPWNFFYWIPTPANVRHFRERSLLRSFLADVIRERRASVYESHEPASKPDLLSGYLTALSEPEEGRSLDETISDAMIILIFAGYDTTSVTLSYATCLVSQHPDVEVAMLQEIRSAKSLDDPRELVYCEAVIREALRLYPPGAAAVRYLQKPLELRGGFVAPTNTLVMISIWLIHHDPQNWPQAEEFRPDRWVKWDKDEGRWVEREETDRSGSIPPAKRDAFLPFSMGARNCAGQVSSVLCVRRWSLFIVKLVLIVSLFSLILLFAESGHAGSRHRVGQPPPATSFPSRRGIHAQALRQGDHPCPGRRPTHDNRREINELHFTLPEYRTSCTTQHRPR